MNPESDVHRRLIGLISTPLGQPYSYTVQAGTGQHSINALRVYLSRVRGILKSHGKAPAEFKVTLVSIDPIKDQPMLETVTLMRITGAQKVQQEIESLVTMFNNAGLEV